MLEAAETDRDPYPVGFRPTATLAEIRAKYADLPTDTATGDRACCYRRVMFIRNTGKLCFATLREGDGTELQADAVSRRRSAQRRWRTGSVLLTSATISASKGR